MILTAPIAALGQDEETGTEAEELPECPDEEIGVALYLPEGTLFVEAVEGGTAVLLHVQRYESSTSLLLDATAVVNLQSGVVAADAPNGGVVFIYEG